MTTPHHPYNHRPGLRACFIALAALASALSDAQAAPTKHNVSAGLIQLQGAGTPTSTVVYEINSYGLAGSPTLGTVPVQIGPSATDDGANGILLTSPAQNITTYFTTNNYNISMIETNANGSYHIAVYKSGNENAKDNCNVAGAYFPYSSWIGGHFRSDPYGNGFTNNLFTGTPGLVAGVNVVDLKLTQNLGGRSLVNLTNLGINSQTDGILIVNHGKDRSGDGNYAVSFPNADGTWTVWVRDHTGGSEQDPMAFVFVPKTNTAVISGRFKGTDPSNNLILMYSGNTPAFTVTNVGSGRWDLRIPGYGPTNGVLIVTGEGGGGQNADNAVTYQPYADGSGWEIQSRDLPDGGLQTPDSGASPIADFVFLPGPTPGITVTPTNNLQTSENGGSATFSVVLDSKPSDNVTISVTSSNPGEGVTDQSSLTFTPSNWETPQVVTVTGVDDAIQDGIIAYTIVLGAASSTDAAYNGLVPTSVSVINLDNEPGISITKNSVVTTEAGGSDSFDVFLNSQPTDTVTFNLSSSNPNEGTVSPTTLTFTPDNWNIPQTVSVTGVDDFVDDGNAAYTIITSAATSTDPVYNGVNPLDIAAINVDNDTTGLTFSQSTGLTVAEPNTTTNFTVMLNSQPLANVTVSIVSADTTEGVVSPASVTFTPGNWNVPKTFTLTAVDDAVNDGDINYNLNVTVTSGDTLYAGVTATLLATTLDNEATLILPSGPLQYATGEPGIGIDGQAIVTDLDSPNFNGGTLTFTLTTGGTADDRLEVRNDGTDIGQIGVSGSTVSYAGTSIGTLSGGVGTAPLIISFNANSTPDAVQALVRAVTFRDVSASPSEAPRGLGVALADGVGGTSTATKLINIGIVHVLDFQNGVDHGYGVYSNEMDIELWDLTPDNSYPAGSDPANGMVITGPDNQVLMRFDNIIGTGLGQIPPDAIIVSADLSLNVTVSGSGTALYQMLIPWDGSFETYNSIGFGVDQDNIESTNVYTSQIGTFPLSGATTIGVITVSVLPDVQAWQHGLPNYGWVLPGWNGGSKTDISPGEAANLALRPHLNVKWVPAGTSVASFRYGVNGYTSAFDTSLRKGSPNTSRATATGIFVDAEVTAPNQDPEEPLLRFDNIIGFNTDQVPAGSKVHIAVLDIGSTVGDAMGDGGSAYRMLVPWQDTDTWNSLGGGINADGIKAVSTPTFTAGSPNLTPDVQGGYLTFEVTPDVQAWVNGAPDYGWVFLPWSGGGNGWGFATAENSATNSRPQLRVYFTAPLMVRITSLVKDGSGVTLQFTGPASSPATIYRANAVTGPYISVGTTGIQANGTASYLDSNPPAGQAFYRISSP